MHSRRRRNGRRVALVAPVGLAFWVVLGSASALAAPVTTASASGNGASHGSTIAGNGTTTGGTAGAPATPNPNGNGGVGQTNGNGNLKHEPAPAPAGGPGSPPVSPSDPAGAAPMPGAQIPGAHPSGGGTTTPQPLSHADQNSGGANNGGNCGAYCSTRDGSPSGNGNGGGKAKGKPCAGCVGKADNKNPKGQADNGNDHNAGYECDRNHGVGRSNPAHTGCRSATTCAPPLVPDGHGGCQCPAGTASAGNGTCQPPCTGPACTPCTGASCTPCTGPACTPCAGPACTPCAGSSCTPCTGAGCLPCAGPDCTPTVLGEHHRRQVRTPTTRVLAEKVVKAPDVLPFTGADVTWLLSTGVLFVGLGGLLLAVAGWRQRRTT